MSTDSPPSQTVLVAGRSGSGGRGSAGVLHIPDSTGDEPLCGCTRTRSDGWWQKDISVYPPAWRDWCAMCLDAEQRRDT